MKTQPRKLPRKEKSTSDLLFLLGIALLLLSAVMSLTSCQLTVGTDGTRTWSLNGEQAAKAIIVISEK
jgi:hypothetical protein